MNYLEIWNSVIQKRFTAPAIHMLSHCLRHAMTASSIFIICSYILLQTATGCKRVKHNWVWEAKPCKVRKKTVKNLGKSARMIVSLVFMFSSLQGTNFKQRLFLLEKCTNTFTIKKFSYFLNNICFDNYTYDKHYQATFLPSIWLS